MKNRTLSLLLLGLISFAFATTTQAQVPPEQARNFQINTTHTGSIAVENLTPPLTQKWVVNFRQPISYPLIADGRVFVTVKNSIGHGTRLFALDATNGSTLWARPLGGTFWWSAACYENGRVFALNGDGVLRAFDAATGNPIWSNQLPGQFSFDSAPTVHEGVIYTAGAGSGGTVYAVSADSGSVLWTAPVVNGSMSSPVVTSEGVYVSYSCPNVYKLDPATGATIWEFSNGCSGGGGKTPVLYNERLYVRDFSHTIHDSNTGTVIGNFSAKNAPVFSGSRGFFLHEDGFVPVVEARDVNTNAVLWSFAGDGFLQSALLVVNDYVYVGSSLGKLYAIDAATGQQVWETTAGSSIPFVDEHNVSQPLTSFAAAEGLLVIPTSTTLVAYVRDTTPPETQAFTSGTAGTNGWHQSAVQVTLSATDDLSGVQSTFYRIDAGATQTYSGPFVISALGQHTVEYWSVDNSNNVEVPHLLVIKIDTVAPVVTAAANPSTAPKKPQPVTVTISGSVTDAVSGVSSASFNVIDEYGVAQPSGPVTVQANGTYSFTLTLPATKQGSDKNGHLYTIVVTGVDQAGNSATATTTLTIN
ncbi:MAG TPA: PQQ-binding-like beta-propeller repeat protein [Pyrinomonadaceae bacterium]|nr:PQQ-binding-like beta-propeller repeat protein [Pyrinomonadaceae bacterium]